MEDIFSNLQSEKPQLLDTDWMSRKQRDCPGGSTKMPNDLLYK